MVHVRKHINVIKSFQFNSIYEYSKIYFLLSPSSPLHLVLRLCKKLIAHPSISDAPEMIKEIDKMMGCSKILTRVEGTDRFYETIAIALKSRITAM